MLYFIPAWYQKNSWRELEQCWYERRMHTEFDDTVKQIQMFHRSGMRQYKILLLSHAPNFRHFLHRQGVFHAPYWSCFDSIQEVNRKKIAVFSFHNLNWPDRIEFVYTPFSVLAFLDGEQYAKIEFGEAGNPIEVSMFENGTIIRKNRYDDRGFISCTEVYAGGENVYTDYLTETGMRKLREYKFDGHVEINPKSNRYIVRTSNGDQIRNFNKNIYSHMGEIIKEVLEAHLEANRVDDIFCIAMDEKNFFACSSVVNNRNAILSFYGDRYRIRKHPEARETVRKAGYIITDSEATTRYLKREMKQDFENILDISPYDSRVDFGISGELTVQKILVPVDDMPDDRFEMLMEQLAIYLQTNDAAMVHIFTRRAEYQLPKELLEKIADILEKAGFDRDMALKRESDETTGENELGDEDEPEEKPVRFFVEQCVDELSVSRCIREQRIMVDMRHNPDLYLQINCISTAIPQIVRRETQYMKNGYNGFVVKEFEKIPAAIDFYLGSLYNWNQAKVYAYDIGQEYTTRKLLEKWKTVMDVLEQ